MPKAIASNLVQMPAAVRQRGHPRTSMLISDYALLCCLGLCLAIVIAPAELMLERLPTKHVPIIFALVALLAILLGKALFPSRAKIARATGDLPKNPSSIIFLPLLLLALLIVAGGSWARFILDTQNSFLVAGIYCFVAPLTAYLLLQSSDALRLLRSYFLFLITASIVVFAILAMNYGVKQVYHELQFLFPPIAVLAALTAKTNLGKLAGISYFIVLAALFKKNTGYLIALLVLAYIAALYLWPLWKQQKDVLRRSLLVYGIGAGALACTLLLAYLFINREQYLPSGNPAFRLVTYERAWLRFLDSPLWGNFFTGPAAERFTAFDTGVSNNILPTHSDLLDILAHGGLLGIALWGWAMMRIARSVLRTLRLRTQSPLLPYVHTLACMSLGAILTYAFNPILLQPSKALLLWSHVGLMVGAVLLIARENRSHAQ